MPVCYLKMYDHKSLVNCVDQRLEIKKKTDDKSLQVFLLLSTEVKDENET